MKKAQAKNVTVRAKSMAPVIRAYNTGMKTVAADIQTLVAKVRAAIKDGIPSGVKGNAVVYAEYQRRIDEASQGIFDGGYSGCKTVKRVKDNLRDGLIKLDKWTPPIRLLSKGEAEEKKRAIVANAKAKSRAVAKIKDALRAEAPNRKWKEGELDELAKARHADQKAESRGRKAQRDAVASKLEGKTGFNVLAFPIEVKEGKYSDGAMPRSLAAFAAFITTFKEEAEQ